MAKAPTKAEAKSDAPQDESNSTVQSVAQKENPTDAPASPLTAEAGANIGPLTQHEAALVSAVDTKEQSRKDNPELEAATDASVKPKSQTIQNPDAEMRADLATDVRTQQRERMRREVREAGEGAPDAEEMVNLGDAVDSAQRKVDEAIRERDAARDAYDRAAERANIGIRPEQAAVDYVASQQRQREEAAAATRGR